MSVANNRPEEKDAELKQKQVQQFVAKLRELGIKMVVFDLDQTACKRHSGGVLPREETQAYIDDIAPDFLTIVPVLAKEGFYLSICTFTDSHYYFEEGGDIRFPKAEYIAGHELVNAFLEKHFDKEIVDKFFNVPYHPGIHDDPEIPNDKNYHLKKVWQYYKKQNIPLAPKECILFDDTRDNVTNARGFKAVVVDRGTAFQLPVPGMDALKK